MTTVGLVVRLEPKHDKRDEVADLLRSARPLVQQENGTTAWFAVQFSRSEYGIFDAFPAEADRDAHLSGAVASALLAKAGELLSEPPNIQKVSILSDKLPAASTGEITKGLILTFRAKKGHEQDVEQFLRDAKPLVEAEPETLAWFALRFDDGVYGIFDVFPDLGGRFAHLAGHVPRELAKHSLTLLGSVPDLDLLDVLASAIRV
jgi:quinol monooxygenase YgiN